MARVKASKFFGPFQLGVACPAGADKLVHGLRRCIRDHWENDDFVACKIDLRSAFDEVTRKALLEECVTHFPELSVGVLVLRTASHLAALHRYCGV